MPLPMLPLTLALALLAFGAQAEPGPRSAHDLEPCINGEVSAGGRFPNQAMEDAFHAYLRWTKDEGLSPLVAFESVIGGGAADDRRALPTPDMAKQFEAYLRWVDEAGLSPFHAFAASSRD